MTPRQKAERLLDELGLQYEVHPKLGDWDWEVEVFIPEEWGYPLSSLVCLSWKAVYERVSQELVYFIKQKEREVK